MNEETDKKVDQLNKCYRQGMCVRWEEYERLKAHSAMLGQIAVLVEKWCPTSESTTLSAVEYLIWDLESEQRWACHYHKKFVECLKDRVELE